MLWLEQAGHHLRRGGVSSLGGVQSEQELVYKVNISTELKCTVQTHSYTQKHRVSGAHSSFPPTPFDVGITSQSTNFSTRRMQIAEMC